MIQGIGESEPRRIAAKANVQCTTAQQNEVPTHPPYKAIAKNFNPRIAQNGRFGSNSPIPEIVSMRKAEAPRKVAT